jgi:GNAT superfamily N-acetyltransferase
VEFPLGGGVEVVVSAGSRICPPGWSGVVVIGDAGIATVPQDSLIQVLSKVLAGLPLPAVTDADQLRTRLPIRDVLGPATLAYLDAAHFRPVEGRTAVEELPPDGGDLAALLASVNAADAEESGLGEITSKAFAVRSPTGLVAVAGYRVWPGSTAHLSVLTAPEHRGQGLAQVVASAAAKNALENELLPQWRARPEPSRRVAAALGFHQLGSQLSMNLTR